MRQHKPPAAAQGFTLVELLVALTVMALLSVILFGGVRFGVRAWDVGGDRIERTGRIESVQNLLRREVSQTWLPSQPSDEGSFATFVGRSDSLLFIASLPVNRGTGGLYLLRLTQHEHDGRSDLMLAWQLYRPERLGNELAEPEDKSILLEGVAGIELAYYGTADPEQPMQWWDMWDGIDSLPQLVRLRVDFPSGDARRWPDLIIRVAGSAG